MSLTYIFTVHHPPLLLLLLPLPPPALSLNPLSSPAFLAVEIGRLWGDVGVDPRAREDLLLVRRLKQYNRHQRVYLSCHQHNAEEI